MSIEIKKGEEPVNLRPYPIPVKRKAVFLKEINRLIDIRVLRREEVHNASEWSSPSFIIPKTDESVRFLSDFRKLNAKIIRKPYPIPKILVDANPRGIHIPYYVGFKYGLLYYKIR